MWGENKSLPFDFMSGSYKKKEIQIQKYHAGVRWRFFIYLIP